MAENELSGDYLEQLGLPLTLVGQGAEARVWRVPSSALAGYELAAVPAGASVVLKERFPKTYRHPTLDATLTRRRTRAEARTMERLRASAVRVPAVYWPTPSDARRRGATPTGATTTTGEKPAPRPRLPACVLAMEDVGTLSAKAFIGAQKRADDTYGAEAFAVCRKLGAAIAAMHAADVVHGDLTTSNAMLVAEPGDAACPHAIAMIDFGLSAVSASVEDKAVDLYVLERAFLCTHEQSEALVETVFAAYAATAAELAHTKTPATKKQRQGTAAAAEAAAQSVAPKNAVLDKLCQVRQRGRKKLAFG